MMYLHYMKPKVVLQIFKKGLTFGITSVFGIMMSFRERKIPKMDFFQK